MSKTDAAAPSRLAGAPETRPRRHRLTLTLARLDALPAAAQGSVEVLNQRAEALFELGRFDEAVPVLERLITLQPAPAHRHSLGLALQALGRFAEAEAAFRRALAEQPHYRDVHIALSDLVMMRTGDLGAAVASMDAVLRTAPTPAIVAAMARFLIRQHEAKAAYGMTVSALRKLDDPELNLAASMAAAALKDWAGAETHAMRAAALAPTSAVATERLAEARVAVGRLDEAEAGVAALLAGGSDKPSVLALRDLIWRLKGDARYRPGGYEAVVRTYRIGSPQGWSDLASTLHAIHGRRSRSVGNSHRGGTKTLENLARSPDPALVALFSAFEAPIADYLAALGAPGGFEIPAAWSINLAPGGRHASHIHPEGQVSSAFYVLTPASADDAGREGWLQFGEPALPLPDPLPADYFVKPEPGLLVLFPSHLPHSTVPFAGPDNRLSVAFDVVTTAD